MSWEIIWNDPWKSSYHTLKSKANVTYVNLCCLPTCHSRTPSPIQCFMCGLFHTHYFPHPKITRVHSLFDLAAPHFFPGSQYSRIRKKKLRVAVFRLKGICHLPSTNNKHKKKITIHQNLGRFAMILCEWYSFTMDFIPMDRVNQITTVFLPPRHGR